MSDTKEPLNTSSVDNIVPDLNLTGRIMPKSEKKEEPKTEENSSKWVNLLEK